MHITFVWHVIVEGKSKNTVRFDLQMKMMMTRRWKRLWLCCCFCGLVYGKCFHIIMIIILSSIIIAFFLSLLQPFEREEMCIWTGDVQKARGKGNRKEERKEKDLFAFYFVIVVGLFAVPIQISGYEFLSCHGALQMTKFPDILLRISFQDNVHMNIMIISQFGTCAHCGVKVYHRND